MWEYFFLGLLVGWLVEWIIDWFYWRRGTDPVDTSPGASGRSVESRPAPAGMASGGAARSGAATAAGDAGDAVEGAPGWAAEAAARVAMAAEPSGARMPVVPVAADEAEGSDRSADVAVGTGGRLPAPVLRAPVYRQEDLEAIAGIGPKIGAMLRNNGITTFAELAVTPPAELERIVESTGEEPETAGVETWAEQAQLAAAQDWEGLGRLQDRLQPPAAGAASAAAGRAASGAAVGGAAAADKPRSV
jgi:predicted flap endonuclease-1-like 5' DNA nuclease